MFGFARGDLEIPGVDLTVGLKPIDDDVKTGPSLLTSKGDGRTFVQITLTATLIVVVRGRESVGFGDESLRIHRDKGSRR